LKNYEALNILLGLDFCVCLVSDTFESYRKMSLILRSRLTNVIKINEFSKDQILEIIKERVNSVYKFPMDDNLLKKTVEKSGSNLTFALNMLNTIASKAGRKNVRLIDYITFFEDVLDETSNEDHRIILEILRHSKRLPSGKLYRLYCERLEHPKSERSFRKYIQVLCRQGLIKSIGEKKGREYEIIKNKDSKQVL